MRYDDLIENENNKDPIDEDDEYEEVTSETEHVPDDKIDIISDEQSEQGEGTVEPLDTPDIEIVDIDEDVISGDDFSDEYEAEKGQTDDINILTDTVEIEEDEADILAEHTNEEVKNILIETGDVLKQICDEKLQHISTRKEVVSESELMNSILSTSSPRGFVNAIKTKVDFKENALIAEAKKASPSKGVIRHYFDPAKIAASYEEGGATCVSVLTDEHYFQGKDEYIKLAKDACKLPILRKDFILDTYQVVESRAIGADCILLIMAILDVNKAIELEEKATELGMDVLIEIHNEEELEQALKLKSSLIGVNNRDLKTMEVDISTTEKLVPMIPDDKIVVCESGIVGFADVIRMNECGVRSFLVGDALMSQEDIKIATQGLLGNVV